MNKVNPANNVELVQSIMNSQSQVKREHKREKRPRKDLEKDEESNDRRFQGNEEETSEEEAKNYKGSNLDIQI